MSPCTSNKNARLREKEKIRRLNERRMPPTRNVQLLVVKSP